MRWKDEFNNKYWRIFRNLITQKKKVNDLTSKKNGLFQRENSKKRKRK